MARSIDDNVQFLNKLNDEELMNRFYCAFHEMREQMAVMQGVIDRLTPEAEEVEDADIM